MLTKRKVFEELVLDLSINVTTFFRNPIVFQKLKEQIQQRFANNNSIKVLIFLKNIIYKLVECMILKDILINIVIL